MFPIPLPQQACPPARRRKVKPAPASQPLPRRRRRKVNNNAPPRRRTRSAGPRSGPRGSPWWLLGEFKVHSGNSPGKLSTTLLHPSNFPNTPYGTQCAHYTHRRERRWEIEVRVTTAASTGFRAAVLLVGDPRFLPDEVPSELVWSAILNNSGAMATSTGQRQRARLQIPPSVNWLSNTRPTSGVNMTGMCAGSLVVYLLDPPIGLTGNSEVIITVLARVQLQLSGPMVGFTAWSGGSLRPGDEDNHPPPIPGGEMVIRAPSVTDNVPENGHTATAWLAGGIYQKVYPNGHLETGQLWSYSVYMVSNTRAVGWENNRIQRADPRFLVTWNEPGSGIIQFVGFVDWRAAKAQADGLTGAVPAGAELCLRYSSHNIPWNHVYALGSTAGPYSINFDCIYRAHNAKKWWENAAAGAATFTVPTATPATAYPRYGPFDQPASTYQPTSHVQLGTTEASLMNPPPTTVLGLQPELNSLSERIASLQQLFESLAPPSEPSRQQQQSNLPQPPESQPQPVQSAWGSLSSLAMSLLSRRQSPPPPPPCSPSSSPCAAPSQRPHHGLPLGTNWPPSRPQSAPVLPSSYTTQNNNLERPATSDLSSLSNRPHLEPSSLSSTSYSNVWQHPSGTTPQLTGSEQLPCEWELPECPGCDDPTCDDCFEDDDTDTVTIPSAIGSVDSLIGALSRLGGSEV